MFLSSASPNLSLDSRLHKRQPLDSVTELYLSLNFVSNLWLKMLKL